MNPSDTDIPARCRGLSSHRHQGRDVEAWLRQAQVEITDAGCSQHEPRYVPALQAPRPGDALRFEVLSAQRGRMRRRG